MKNIVLLTDNSPHSLQILPKIINKIYEIVPDLEILSLVYIHDDNLTARLDVSSYPFDIVFFVRINSLHINQQALARRIYEEISQFDVELILSGNSPICKCCSAALAYLYNTGLAADCSALSYSISTGLFHFERIVGDYPPKVATVVVRYTKPQMATFAELNGSNCLNEKRSSKLQQKVFNLGCDDQKTRIEYSQDIMTKSLSSSHKTFFIIGAGVSTLQNAQILKYIADKNNFGFGITRQILNRGWFHEEYLVGISGQRISPNVCITFGVSGAYQHYLGIKDSKWIIAINNEESAPIFSYAQQKILSDVNSLIQNLKKQL